MSSSEPLIFCPNPACERPSNPLGAEFCDACQTPLIYRYFWVVGAEQIAAGETIVGRYQVVAPQIWLDTRPSFPPLPLGELPGEALPYLHLYPHRLHLPAAHTLVYPAGTDHPLLLLENAPLDSRGNLYPSIGAVWKTVPAVRQVYWLWQLLQLWQPLEDQEVATSLLVLENIHVEGWRVRLRELLGDNTVGESREESPPTLKDLGRSWLPLAESAQPAVARSLKTLCNRMQSEISLEELTAQWNQLLVEQAAYLPLQVQIIGATDVGLQRTHNEDTCYPLTGSPSGEEPLPHLAIVCDGIGGHEGGEVASQLAVQTLKLQARALLAELAEQTELVQPDVLANQLEASIRVVNNLIASQNDAQGRESRRRMGTTLVMALQLPQMVKTADGKTIGNAHELYLVHVGDSRAYWLTSDYCHPLTVDDDVAGREVRLGRSTLSEASRRSDAEALTQALGTRDAEFLRPTVQRFILEEDGLLLLCSDGLSDNNWIEQCWKEYTDAVLQRRMPLETAVHTWIQLANQKNGYDNISVVLMHCQISPSQPELPLPEPAAPLAPTASLSEASRQLLYPEDSDTVSETHPEEVTPTRRSSGKWLSMVGVVLLILVAGTIGFVAFQQLAPEIAPEVPRDASPQQEQ